MTPTEQRREAEQRKEAEDGLRSSSYAVWVCESCGAQGPGPGECIGHGLLPTHGVRQRHEMRKVEVIPASAAQSREERLKDKLEDARERLTALWHERVATKDDGHLHEFLGMTWEEYKAWVADPRSALTSCREEAG